MSPRPALPNYFARVADTLCALDTDAIDLLVGRLHEARGDETTVYTFGNGGSGSTASHFAGDLMKAASYGKQRRLRAVCVNDNVPTLMAYANDVDYADIFVEPLRNLLRPGDIAIGISGSGNSENVIRAIEYANGLGAFSVGMCGYDGGRLKKCAKLAIWVNNQHMLQVEDAHLSIAHAVACTLAADD